MLKRYIAAAMATAKYEILPDGEGFYGEIPGFEGLWASAPHLEACRDELESALEDWILFSVERGTPVPVVAGLELWPRPGRTPTRVA